MKSLLPLGIFGLLAIPALAQEQDKDALKRKILRDVEERLKKQDDQLLKDIERMIDEQLGGRKAAPPVEPKPEPRAEPKPEPKPEPKAEPKPFVPRAEAPARKPRGFMGVATDKLGEDEKKDLKVQNGIKVAEVVKDGPADKAGIKVDDVITTIDGRSVDSPQEVPVIVQAAGAGTAVKVEIVRDGKKQTLEVTLARHPADSEQGAAPKPEDPKAPDLRERVKKFLDKKEEAPKAEAPKPEPKPAPKARGEGDFFALDEELFERLLPLFDQLNVDPDEWFEKGKDGKYRFKADLKEMFRNFDFKKFLPGVPFEEEDPVPAPKKVEPKPEPKKEAPKAATPWMGFLPEELPDELRAQLDLEDGVGLLVTQVYEGSPAQKAGLKKNDILTKIDGKPVKGLETLDGFVQTAKIGQEATLTVLRKGKDQTVKVTLAERKE